MEKKLLRSIEWDETIVCFCAGVTRREIAEALALGYQTVESLVERTGASRGCGTCISALSGLVERRHEAWNHRNTVELAEPLFVHESQPFLEKQKGLIAGSLLGLVLSLPVLFFGSLPDKGGLLSNGVFRILKGEAFGSRMTGFALLFMVLLAGALSLYKRRPGRYGQNLYRWRAVHAAVGVLALAMLSSHTGMKLGENFNRFLAGSFLVVMITGSLNGIVHGFESSYSIRMLKKAKPWFSRVHLVSIWLLPVLVLFHILLAYYF